MNGATQSSHDAAPDVTDVSEVDSMPLDLDDLFDVQCELNPVSAKWKSIGIALRLSPNILDRIQAEKSGEPSACLTLVVTEWLKRNYNVNKFGEPTWQRLVEAVGHPAGGADMALARKIARNHKAGVSVTQQTPPSSQGVAETRMTTSLSRVFARESQETITAKFAAFQTKVCNKLFRNGVDTKQIRQFVINQFPPGDCIPPPTASLLEVFEALTYHGLWDYNHYSPLVRIVRTFGAKDMEMESWVQTYKKDLKAYLLVTTIEDYIEADLDVADIPPVNHAKYDRRYCCPVELKLDTNLIDHSLQHLAEVWEMFSGCCLVPDSPPTALLDRVRRGCFSVTWLVPSGLIPPLVERIKVVTAFFQQHHILKVTVGGECVYEELTEKNTLEPQPVPLKETLLSKPLPEPEEGAYLEPKVTDQKEVFGGYDCKFMEPPPSAFQTECPICQLILRNPYQVTCCGTNFCHSCSDRFQANKNPCPTCREDNFDVFPNKGLTRSLNQLYVLCIYKKDGCEWTGELGELEHHLNEVVHSATQISTVTDVTEVDSTQLAAHTYEPSKAVIFAHENRQTTTAKFADLWESTSDTNINTNNFLMPWEHYVCSACLKRNPHAIWLVKCRCLEPQQHGREEQALVIIDHNSMEMVRIRPLPQHHSHFRGEFMECRNYPNCHHDQECKFAHSKAECDTWNIKKRILGATVDVALVKEVNCTSLQCQSPTYICETCFKANSSAVWLAWLKCIHPDEHQSHPKVTAVVSLTGSQLVKVRQPPPSLQGLSVNQPQLCRQYHQCSRQDSCTFAHSQEEVDYWKRTIVEQSYKALDPQFADLCVKYEYPGEDSESVVRGVKCQLTPENYHSKYHRLIYLDDLEHTRKMIQECDGHLDFDVPLQKDLIGLIGMDGAAMDYALQNHATARFTIKGRTYFAKVVKRHHHMDSLLVKVHSLDFFHSFQDCFLEGISVHFEINHWYFWRLHCAIKYLTPSLLQRLIPNQTTFLPPDQTSDWHKRSHFLLDAEYQTKAFKQILACKPGAPYLLVGPFGTGKTQVLAATIADLLETPQINPQVLVCTHQNAGADNLYRSLQEHIRGVSQKALRLVPDEVTAQRLDLHPEYSCHIICDVNLKSIALGRWPVLVTTFLTALYLKDKVSKEGTALEFTHIIIDEGAQSREPEALGAVVLATSSTCLIVAGDNQQVGPQVAVYSKVARENGLGTSLIERLFSYYKTFKASTSHAAMLLTNYQCHPSILMLASSLFYECTLLSRSTSRSHPKAPFPLVFACTSFSQEGFNNLPAENEREAEMIVRKMLEFVKEWPQRMKEKMPRIGLLASSRQQVACLRKKFRYLKPQQISCNVEIMPTYIIAGQEFSAVFLSTHEATDSNGNPRDLIRSVCNEYVFNTIVTRAQSLICAAGNPFLLHHMGKAFKNNCWAEYIQRCIQCQTLILPQEKTEEGRKKLPDMVEKLAKMVFPAKTLDQAIQQDLQADSADAIIDRYIADLQSRREYKVAHKLVQNPKGQMIWEESHRDEPQPERRDIIWCKLDSKDYRTVTAHPTDTTKAPIKLEGLSNRRLAFHGDVVPIDTINKCVLLNADTEKAVSNTHFGASFLCRVDPKNPVQFFPLDKQYPKFVNLPTLTRREANGVVCFDPKSSNSSPRMNNFIPMECAVKMLFIVKFLGWRAKYPYPLGIIVGAMPAGYAVNTGDLVLRIAHNIPFAPCQPHVSLPSSTPHNTSHIFKDAFSIDPEGSSDHDDALTCALVRKEGDSEEYQIGVHITNVQKYIQKGTELDKVVMERGCSVYRSPDNCVSPMLPEVIIQASSIDKGKPRDAFSVVARVTLKNGGVQRIHRVTIIESQIISSAELTYQAAQAIIIMTGSSTHALQPKLKVLLKVASFLRTQRLGSASGYHKPSEPEEEVCLEAHMLITELMIWANHEVATKLVKAFPNHTIFRVQPEPNEEKVQLLLNEHAPYMAACLDLQRYVPQDSQSCTSVQILQSILVDLRDHLANGRVREALRFIQFENFHPQLAVVHALFSFACSPSSYCLSGSGKPNYTHDSLRCDYYTHFTSPIRRFIDIVIQRLLHAALNNQECPYRTKELEEICEQAKITTKQANSYEHDITKLVLATELQESSKTFPGFVMEVKENKLQFCFSDLALKVLHSQETSIHLKCVNATTITPQGETERPEAEPAASMCSVTSHSKSTRQQEVAACKKCPMYSWKVKVSSILGTPRQFLGHPDLEFTGSGNDISSEAHTKVSFFIPEGSGTMEEVASSHLVEHKLQAKIKSQTTDIPKNVWQLAQACVKEDPQNLSAPALLRRFPTISPCEDASLTCDSSILSSSSPLWIYEIHQPVQPYEVFHVQMSATRQDTSLAPCIQLLEVGPGLSICIQHNDRPTECFTDKLTVNASEKAYISIQEYFQSWEKVILAEAAISSITDSELLLIKDVPLIWPKLSMQIESNGQVYYQLHIPEGEMEAGVCMKLPEQFVKSSYDFFKFNEGDLACVRYNIGGSSTKFVLHMVVYHVKHLYTESCDLVGIDVYLKIAGQKSNYISSAMKEVLTRGAPPRCEVQLIPLSLPYQRIYHSLCEFVEETKSHRMPRFAEQIALGRARTAEPNPDSIQLHFPREEASIATSLWPLRPRPDGRGRFKLNKYQRKAIDLACSNTFVMIQGPPGTGKSVTGAHMAYALAMKLKEVQASRTSSRSQPPASPRPCVMYCGPSQQSVNVVLDILTAPDSPVRGSLNIVRIYSKAIEQKDFPGPKHHTEVFHQECTDASCDRKSRDYALHYLIRDTNPKIREMDAKFKRQKEKIPSGMMRSKYRALVHETERAVLSSGVDIILCTCNEASSHRVTESIRPAYCIIDECVMATEPECMVPIRRADHVVLIGDHRQLQPVLNNREAEQMGLGRSLFERYVDEVGVKAHMLQVQYRMHEALCEFPSQEFYDSKLLTDDSVRFRRNHEAQLHGFWPNSRKRPFVFCDIIGTEVESHTGQKGTARVGLESKYNVKEAKKIVQIVLVLIDDHEVDPCQIAVLTPYSAQREEIRKQLGIERVGNIQVKTITESQGSEYGIVLLSMVRSRKLNEITTRDGRKKKADIGWLRANLGFVTDKHQICVGITRCKYGLVIVGNKVLLSYDPTWNALIEHYKKNGCLVKSSEFPCYLY